LDIIKINYLCAPKSGCGEIVAKNRNLWFRDFSCPGFKKSRIYNIQENLNQAQLDLFSGVDAPDF